MDFNKSFYFGKIVLGCDDMQEIIIISIIVLIILFILLCLFSQNNTIKEVNYKISVAFEEIKKNLEKERDIIDRLVNIIEREIKKENKTFNNFKKTKGHKLNEHELDNFLTEISNLIFEIKNDNSKLSKVKSFDGLITELNEISNNLIAIRTYYNKYVGKYNNLVSKKSFKLISIIKKYKTKKFFEGEEIKEETII